MDRIRQPGGRILVQLGLLGPRDGDGGTDGSGGAFVVWSDGPPSNRDVFINWVDGSGAKPWGDGSAVCTASQGQQNLDIVYVGSGNTVVCWEDDRDGFVDLYAQKVDGFGTTLWTNDGVNITDETRDQFDPRLVSSGTPELVVVFRDTRGGDRVAAQKIDASGGRMWTPEDVDVLEGDLIPKGWDVDSDGAGGLIATVSWNDNIYAQAINARGSYYAAEPTIKGIADVPDDQGGWVRITIGYSDRDTVGVVQEQCARYDVWREIDASAAPAQAKAPSRGGVSFCELNGVRYLESNAKPDGSIFDRDLPVYNTAVSVMALCALGDPRHAPMIESARNYMVDRQTDEGEGYEQSDKFYGGIGYGNDERPDLSNLQFALEGLHAAALDKDDPAWDRAIAFLERCQNRSESNDQEWAANDGGFVYAPGLSMAGETKSYGSMTYAGIKSFIYADLDRDARLWRFVLAHEAQHDETLTFLGRLTAGPAGGQPAPPR